VFSEEFIHMTISLKRFGLAVAVLGLVAGAVGRTEAALLIYTDQGTGSGSLGSTPFTDALVTVSFTGDTTNVISEAGFGFRNLIGTATVTVAGVGTATFTDSMEAFVNQPSLFAGIGDTTLGTSVLATDTSPLFATYDLKGPIGPISGTAFFNVDVSFPTTLGGFVLNSIPGDTSFTATVPEPASLILAGTAALMGLGSAWRHRKRATA
jgi:hypothetical protein